MHFPKTERGKIVLISFFVALLPVVSELWALLRTPADKFFVGINTMANLNDIVGVYFAAIRNFSEGDILYRNPYSPLPPFFHYPLYLILGKISSIFSLPVILVYHTASFLLVFAFSLMIYKFLKLFFKQFSSLILALGLSLFGGLIIYGAPEASAFLSFWEPHFVLAQMSLFGALYCFYLIANHKISGKRLVLFSVSVLLLNLTHSWMTILLGIFCLLWILYLKISKKDVKESIFALITLSVISFPFLFYYANSATIPWNVFSLTSSWYLPLQLYGMEFVIAILGLWLAIKQKNNPIRFLAVWFLVQVALIFSPFPFQRRFIEGMYLPIAVFAVLGIDYFVKRLKFEKSKNMVYGNFFVYLSAGVIASYGFLFYWLPNGYVYRGLNEKSAWEFLDGRSDDTKKILSLPLTSILILSRADIVPYAGHEIQTLDFDRKNAIVNSFFSGKLGDSGEILRQEKICYVYFGPQERFKSKVDFSQETYLSEVFKNGDVSVYQANWCK